MYEMYVMSGLVCGVSMIAKMPNCASCNAVADGVDASYDSEGKIIRIWLCRKCLGLGVQHDV